MRQQTRRYSVFFQLMKQSSVFAVITTVVVSFSLSAQTSVPRVNSVKVSRQATADSRSSGAQADKETQLLKPGEPVSREIAGGQVHTFRIALAAGQFMRVVLDQKVIDLALALIAPDGKQVVEVNITSAGRLESLSAEAAASGDYRLTVRAIGAATLAGAYEVSLEVRAAATELDRKRIAAERLLVEGSKLMRTGSTQQAVEEAEQALALWRELRDRYWEAHTLNLLGIAYKDLGRNDRAIEYYERALQIRREVKDRAGEGSVLNNLAIVYNNLSRYEKAIEYYEQALQIRREAKASAAVGQTLTNLAVIYFNLGRSEKAIEYAEQSLQINRETKDRFSEGITLDLLGSSYAALGRHEKAIEYLEQGLAIARELKARQLEASVLRFLGSADRNLGHYEKAIEYYEQSLQISREVKDRYGEGLTLGCLGTAYDHLGRFEKAIEYHEQSLSILREVRSPANEAWALYSLMVDWQGRNQPRLAIFYGKQAVNKFQEIRNEILGLERESQQSFVKSNEDAYRMLADLLIAEGRLPEAEQVINLLKQEEYFDFIRRDSANAPATGRSELRPEEAALEKRYREVADQLTALGAERGLLLVKKSRSAEEEQRMAKLDADLVVAGNAFQTFLDQLEAELGRSAASSGKIYELRESQGLMEDLRELGVGTVALYTLVGADKYRVILTTPACNTATGGSGANGKEVEGFGVLAQRQGAKAVLASLWPVADRSTTILMKEFYRMRESQAGMTKAEALRQAQLSLLHGDAERRKGVEEKRGLGLEKDSGEGQQRAFKADAKTDTQASYAHPYYWAPFILIGNWK